jgi:hypothetical protein
VLEAASVFNTIDISRHRQIVTSNKLAQKILLSKTAKNKCILEFTDGYGIGTSNIVNSK